MNAKNKYVHQNDHINSRIKAKAALPLATEVLQLARPLRVDPGMTIPLDGFTHQHAFT